MARPPQRRQRWCRPRPRAVTRARLVLRRVAALLAAGAALGAGISLWAAKFVTALVFQVNARDPAMLAGAATVLLSVGLLAGWLPARHASRLDPTATLRH